MVIYFLSFLPVELAGWEGTIIIIPARINTWFAARYPARRAAELEPVQAMNYNH